MNEATATASFKKKLIEAGFLVRKLADKATKGLPDCFAVRNGRVYFLEMKYFNVRNIPIEFNRWSRIEMIQLMTMVELEKKGALAYYIFFYNLPLGKVQLCYLSPSKILAFKQMQMPLALPGLYEFYQGINALFNESSVGAHLH